MLQIVVLIKSVPDNSKLTFRDDGPDLTKVSWMLNPYDEYALEAALRLKDQTQGTITVLSCGEQQEPLKKALALGADYSYLLQSPTHDDPSWIARYLAAAIKTLVPDVNIIMTGQISLDSAQGQTGPSIAAILGLPWLGRCKRLIMENSCYQVVQDIPEGLRTLAIPTPIVLSFIKGYEELRTPNIKGVMKANKLEIPKKSATDFGLQEPERVLCQQVGWLPRKTKEGGQIVPVTSPEEAATAFVTYLTQEHLR